MWPLEAFAGCKHPWSATWVRLNHQNMAFSVGAPSADLSKPLSSGSSGSACSSYLAVVAAAVAAAIAAVFAAFSAAASAWALADSARTAADVECDSSAECHRQDVKENPGCFPPLRRQQILHPRCKSKNPYLRVAVGTLPVLHGTRRWTGLLHGTRLWTIEVSL